MEEIGHIRCTIRERRVCRIFLIMEEKLGMVILKAGADMWEFFMPDAIPEARHCDVVCNMHTTSQELALPTLPSGKFWKVIADTGCEGQCFFPEGRKPELAGEKTVKVAPRTIMIMAGRKDAAD